jgi:hypothetical protein
MKSFGDYFEALPEERKQQINERVKELTEELYDALIKDEEISMRVNALHRGTKE